MSDCSVPKVGVAIVNWNSQDMLVRALQALARQTTAPHRVIVVDNASADFAPVQDVPVNTVFRQMSTNTGFARGNNIAVEALRDCDWIALVNPDAFLAPDWIESVLRAASERPEFAFFATRTLIEATPELLDGAGDAYHVSGLVWRIGFGRPASLDSGQRREVFGPCAAAAVYKREAFEAVGGFDEDFFCYVEDVDLAFRLRLAGYRCLYVPDAVALHVGSGTTGGQHSPFSVYHGHRNIVWAYVKNMPGWLLWVTLPLHLAMNIIVMLFYIRHGQANTIIRAKWDAVKGLPGMWRKRKGIQAKRRIGPRDAIRLMSRAFWPSARGI
ncbi:glycosyltransferase family 2 protein [Burkholderia sp. S171]|uniref:glycosyltransferase family 2 protein n=1 Tax=Burkholderia sp. S171 TaxID=1641860 RepID=UPI00131A6AF6|nr:glycosyltransferase family 2 protein [Burkholderia sp. S171]